MNQDMKANAQTAKQLARTGIAEASQRLAQVDRRARTLSHDHPFLALAGAVFFGFIVGRAASRA